jgi:GTP-binding protein
VVALNKWDLLDPDETERGRLEYSVKRKLRFLDWATFVRTSALTKRGLNKLLPAVENAIASHRTRMTTSSLNQLVLDVQQQRPHPRSGDRQIKILYAVQASVAPPTVILFANGRLDTHYTRFIQNQIREARGFEGTPIRIEVRTKVRDNS